MTQPPQTISDKLKDPLLKSRLLAYAAKKAKPFKNSAHAPHVDAEDLVQETYKQIYEGSRPWNPEKCPDFFRHCAGCIKSNLSNITTKNGGGLPSADCEPDDLPDTAEKFVELKEEIEDFCIFLLEDGRDDIVTLLIVMLEHGLTGSKELADHFEIPVKDVDNMKARLKRFYKKYSNKGGA